MSAQKLHIVHLVSGDQWAGAEALQSHLLTHLASQAPGCELSVICLNEGELARRLSDAHVEVVVLPESSLSFGEIFWRSRNLLAARRPHILHSHRFKEHFLAAALAPLLRARTVATVHGLPEPARTRRLRYELQTALTLRLLRTRFDRVVAVSSDLRRRLIADCGFAASKLDVVINGIPIPPAAPQARQDDTLHVGSVGRFVTVKRFELFLEAVALLNERFPKVEFSILGDGPEREMLVQRAVALGVSDRVRLMRPVLNPHPYFESLDVYVNTSAHEGLPLTVLEAMAHGVPVVASAVGGIPEIARNSDEAILVSSSQPADFAAAISRLLEDATERRRIGQAGR